MTKRWPHLIIIMNHLFLVYLPISLSSIHKNFFILCIPIFIPAPRLPISPIERSKNEGKRRRRSRYRSPACRFIGAHILSPHLLQRLGSVSWFNFDFPLHLSVEFWLRILCACTRRSSGVCRKWRQGVKESLARKESLSFSGWKTDDESTTRLVQLAYSLKELDMYCFSIPDLHARCVCFYAYFSICSFGRIFLWTSHLGFELGVLLVGNYICLSILKS